MKKIKIAWVLPFLFFVFGYVGTYLFLQQEATITPNVIGKSLQEGVVTLSQHRLGIRLMREQEDVSMPEGIILDQIPRSNNKIRPNQNVFVTISRKPSILSAPNFFGCSISDIQKRASRNDIDLLKIDFFSQYSRNTCFAQYPKPGQQLYRKRMITYISNGKFPLFIVPNFKGMQVEQVKDFLRSNDMKFEIVHSHGISEEHTCANCYVTDQRPISGSIFSFDQSLQIQLQVCD